MTPSEDLFKLIKSLTPNEKGYFKKFSRIHVREGKNNYMLLFEAIDKQSIYEEQALIHKFRNEQFVKQFPVAKNYLYNLILKALDVYHSGIDLEIGYLIHCSIILTDKAMFEPALKFLKKAELISQEHHKLSYLNKILNHELYIIRRDPTTKKKEVLDAHYKQRVENADQLRYVIEYQHLNDLMFEQFNRSFGPSRDEAIKESKKLMEQPLMKKVPPDLSLYGQIEYHSTCLFYHSICLDHTEAFRVTSLLMNEVLKKYENILPSRMKILIMQNHCTSCINTSKPDEAVRTLEKLKQIETTNDLERLTVFQFIYLQELIIFLRSGRYDESLKVIEMVEKELSEFGEKMQGNPKGFLFQLIALTHFANAQYKEALKWVNRLLNSKLTETRNDIINSAKLLELLIFYETDKNDIIHYKIESFERSFKKDREKFKYELLMLSHFKKLLQLHRSSDVNSLAAKIKDELTIFIEKNPASKDVFYRFDIRDWLESKSTGRSLAEILCSGKGKK